MKSTRTATFDGLSIAWAVVEYLSETVGCRALFATHYHELTHLTGRLSNLACHSLPRGMGGTHRFS